MKKIFLIILAAITITSCSKDFLELNPQAQANSEGFYKTQSDFNTAVIGAYARFRVYPNMYFEMSSFRSDELSIGAPTAGTQDRFNIDKFQDDPSNQVTLGIWADLYNGINRCNEIIDRLPDANFTPSFKNQYEAEAKFIRAYHYYNLVNFWGNVPLVTTTISPDQALTIGGSNKEIIYALISNDLKFAINNLPQSYSNSIDVGRATSAAAAALLARILLDQKKYNEVISVLQPIIGRYSLLSRVGDVFNVNNKNNAEIIFSIRFNKEALNSGHGLWLSTTSTTSSQVPPSVLNSYHPTNDRRRDLLLNARSGTSNIFVPAKFLDVISTTTRNAGNDWILLRYAEVLLMYAEAANEISYEPTGNAFTYLNLVRSRATQNLTPLLTSVDFPNQLSFRNAIFQEYKLEFPYEGQRWFTLLRSQLAISTIATTENVVLPTFRLIFPIPQSEIQKINNPAIFPQNPGYNN